jgi:hypothetical protein
MIEVHLAAGFSRPTGRNQWIVPRPDHFDPLFPSKQTVGPLLEINPVLIIPLLALLKVLTIIFIN